MRLRVTAARLLGTAALMLPLAVQAADLDDPDPRYVPRAESPYDDPRYRDLYADPEPPRYAAPRRDAYRPYPPSSKDDGYLAPPVAPPRFSEAPRYEREPGCLPRRDLHARLAANGWSDFHDIDIRGRIAYVKAQRPSGQLFDLEIDRCNGGIISARRIAMPERPYAWRGPGYGSPRY